MRCINVQVGKRINDMIAVIHSLIKEHHEFITSANWIRVKAAHAVGDVIASADIDVKSTVMIDGLYKRYITIKFNIDGATLVIKYKRHNYEPAHSVERHEWTYKIEPSEADCIVRHMTTILLDSNHQREMFSNLTKPPTCSFADRVAKLRKAPDVEQIPSWLRDGVRGSLES
jgi:hypothetical protein